MKLNKRLSICVGISFVMLAGIVKSKTVEDGVTPHKKENRKVYSKKSDTQRTDTQRTDTQRLHKESSKYNKERTKYSDKSSDKKNGYINSSLNNSSGTSNSYRISNLSNPYKSTYKSDTTYKNSGQNSARPTPVMIKYSPKGDLNSSLESVINNIVAKDILKSEMLQNAKSNVVANINGSVINRESDIHKNIALAIRNNIKYTPVKSSVGKYSPVYAILDNQNISKNDKLDSNIEKKLSNTPSTPSTPSNTVDNRIAGKAENLSYSLDDFIKFSILNSGNSQGENHNNQMNASLRTENVRNANVGTANEADIAKNMVSDEPVFSHLNMQKVLNHEILFSKESLADYSARLNKIKKMQRLALYIKDNYDVSLRDSEQIVLSAFVESKKKDLEPMLVLSVIGVESTFKQYSKSGAGAVGLTQFIPKYHKEKIARLKNHDVWSIAGNITVGTDVLKEYIDLSKGNVRSGLQRYYGNMGDRKYSSKVLAKMNKLTMVASL